MPARKLWDHAINMKEIFVPRKRKVYLLSREERKEAPVFFVGKKDGKKHMVQDYKYLNEQTIKNNYPLPLILDIVEKIGIKKVFTKMDLRWGYNNVWIKERDEWKAAFTILEESFELTVMFFRLTNSLATFQTMMNEIL